MSVHQNSGQMPGRSVLVMGTETSKASKSKVSGDRKQIFIMWVLCIIAREVSST